MDGGSTAPAAARPPVAPAGVLDAVRRRVAEELAPIAGRIDREGFYPAEIMRGLGADGAFSAHLAAHAPGGRRDLGLAIAAMAAMGEQCMSTAFCAWCQDSCGWYLENSDNAALRERLQPGIATAALLGGTGLSNPMKALSGIEGFKLRATRAEGGYIVSGVLPWVSNLGDGHWFGTIFQEDGKPDHRMMAMVRCGQLGVDIRQNAHFVALEGTGTYSVLFRRAFIADENMLADPLGDMARRIRPGFVLLQTGMALGVIAACIALMHDADRTQGRTNQHLPYRSHELEADLAGLRGTIMTLAATPQETAPDFVRAVLQARLEASELTLRATQAAVLHWGARGYLEGSPVHRRQREGNFVAIITPSIRHLRQEIAALEHA
jgi:alkylation response protein AidB-like acyl-CoA dehydrogenase